MSQHSCEELLYEYNQNVNPPLSPIRPDVFPPSVYERDTSTTDHLLESTSIPGQTSPNLDAHFIHIFPGDPYSFPRCACTSHWFYVIRGRGVYTHKKDPRTISEGDVFVLPNEPGFSLRVEAAEIPVVLFYVTDEPLLRYLGCSVDGARFKAQFFPSRVLKEKISALSHHHPDSRPNRLGFLLGNPATAASTKTITHVLWTLLNRLPKRSAQRPHRHQSIAIDLCVSGGGIGDVYTLMGPVLGVDGWVQDPIRIDWKNGGVFITPPGWWHSHHNDGDEDAVVLPVQDAGLYLYQRTLGIEFSAES